MSPRHRRQTWSKNFIAERNVSRALSSKKEISEAYQNVVAGRNIDWLIYTYDKGVYDLIVQATGNGGLQELEEEFSDGRMQYAFARVIDPNSKLAKFVQINWCGDGVPEAKKSLFSTHSSAVDKFLRGAHVVITARNKSDVAPAHIMEHVESWESTSKIFRCLLKSNVQVRTTPEGPTSFLVNSFSDTLEIPPEIKEARDPRGFEHKESDEDKQQGCNDLQPSFVPDPSESVPAATLQDLTEFITKTGDYPVTRGGFGEIWKCTYRTDRGPIAVAVKSLLVYASDQLGGAMEKKTKVGTSMKVCLLITPSVLQRIHREIRTCARLKHRNILSVYGYTYGFGLFMAIVSPWAENGNLTTYLEREDAHLTIVRRFQILRDITDGLHYLHTNNVIHGDLTGPNVLIHGDGTACLVDFGLSLVYSEVMSISLASWTSTFHGNFRWLAPELLGEPDNEPDNELPVRPSKCSDVYSFGGIMLQVLTSRPPYYYLNEAAVIQRISSGVKPLRSRYPALSDKYWHLIEECWSAAPQDRPLAERIVRVIGDEQDLLARS